MKGQQNGGARLAPRTEVVKDRLYLVVSRRGPTTHTSLPVLDLANVPDQPRPEPGLASISSPFLPFTCACSSSWSCSPTIAGESSTSTSPSIRPPPGRLHRSWT